MNDLVEGCKITGTVKLDDQDIYGKIDVNLLRKRVGMVFQKPNPFPMSIYDNIAYGPRTHGIHSKAKPFGTMELISRIKALLRRADRRDLHTEYRRGDLYLCPAKHIIRVDGRDITLTLKEFELLCLLFENEGIVLTRDEILTKVWGYEFDGESRTVDVHIRTLRAKLGDAGKCIETVRGLGYKIGGGND